jgi:hypothetical protein
LDTPLFSRHGRARGGRGGEARFPIVHAGPVDRQKDRS